MQLNSLFKTASTFKSTEKMPVLFLGHGSPLNAIEINEFSSGWRAMAETMPLPVAILCISAHWETHGTYVTAMEKPRTIHDFGGFKQDLYEVQYPADGSPDLAKEIKALVSATAIELDNSWGLDHGSWSVLRHLFPLAGIPVVQLSLDYRKTPLQHYNLAKELAMLRQKGVLIIGSGNIVHNLRLIDWNRSDEGYDWAMETDIRVRQLILENDHHSLINYSNAGGAFNMAIPTPEHYLPLLYAIGLKGEKEEASFFNTKTIMGSISMTSVRIG